MPRPRMAQSSARRSAGFMRLGWSAFGRFMALNWGMSSLALAGMELSALIMPGTSPNQAIHRYVRRGSPVVHSFTPERLNGSTLCAVAVLQGIIVLFMFQSHPLTNRNTNAYR